MPLNLLFGWFWILCGLVSGAGIGLYFHRENWAGGYGSWRRRLLRLGHISFLGTGLLNIGYGLTQAVFPVAFSPVAQAAFIVGAGTMPVICYLSAWREGWRRLFFIPVSSLLLASGALLLAGLRP